MDGVPVGIIIVQNAALIAGYPMNWEVKGWGAV